MKWFAATLCALLASVFASAETMISGVAQVIDGDTILLGPTPVRIHGIDAPEQGQRCDQPGGGTWPCGNEATQKMAELAQDRRVTCTVRDHDRYSRVIARCEVDGTDLGAAMMEAGLAWAFRQFSTGYLPHETRAAATGIGIWSSDNQPHGPIVQPDGNARLPRHRVTVRSKAISSVRESHLSYPMVALIQPHRDRRGSRPTLVL